MNRFQLKLLSLILLCLSGPPPAQSAQSSSGFDQWKSFTPPTGGFNIRFPCKPAERTDSVEIAGKLFTNYEYSARHISEYRVNYFAIPVDLKDSRAALLKGVANSIVSEYKGAVASEQACAIQGAAGRMLKINAANGAIVQALILATDARVYRVIVSTPRQSSAGNPEETSTAARFLESFVIVPIVSAPPDDTYLVTEEGEVDRFLKKESVASVQLANAGTVNSKATKLATPRLPLALPPNKHYSEMVEVKVIIDERGVVVAAQVSRGHPWFRDVALDAARKSRFDPTLAAGNPVKVQGTIIYNFVKY